MNNRLFVMVFLVGGICGCNQNAPLHKQVKDSEALGETTELRIENAYLMKLEMSLKSGKHNAGAAAVEHHWILVGEEIYNQWKVGQEISTGFDRRLLLGEMHGARKVTIEEKVIDQEYLHLASDGKISSITEQRYHRELEKSKVAKKHLIELSSNGCCVIFVRAAPLLESDITTRNSMTRYYFDLEIPTSSLAFSLKKTLSTSLNNHTLPIEVSEKQFSKYTQALWKPELNSGTASISMAFKGRLSTLSGKITRRFTKEDNVHEKVVLKSGEEIIMKK